MGTLQTELTKLARQLGDASKVSKLESAEDRAAKWQLLFPSGKTKHRADFPNGKLAFDAKFLGSMAKNYAAMGKPRLAINYFHRGMTESGDTTPISEKIAAGWITEVELKDDGLHGLVEWTDRARGYILADEITQLSPEFVIDYRNTDTGKSQGPTLLGAALLNDPFLKELPRVAAADYQPAGKANEGANVDKAKVCAALGLPADASDEDVMKTLAGFVEAAKAKKEEAAKEEQAAKAMADLKDVTVKLNEEKATLVGQVKTLSEKVASFEAKEKDAEAEAFVVGLVGKKITPAMRDSVKKLALTDLALAKSIYEKAPDVVELGEKGIPGSHGGEDKASLVKVAMDKVEARIADLVKSDPKLKWTQAERIALNEMPKERDVLYGVKA